VTPREFVEKQKHLPSFMKDFHDQKLLFKCIAHAYRPDPDKPNTLGWEAPGWTDAQIYTIDHFLWYMGQHGYTLQKSGADVEFRDIHQSLKNYENESLEGLRAILAPKSSPPSP